ncbi:DNA-formamidopyrimidine glycosylase family protein [Bdellovibrio bacteriovorus]
MEGPSIVIACEELKPFLKKKIKKATGTAKVPLRAISGSTLKSAQSWGKHLLLFFTDVNLRIHFLMFGSYRINNPRENRIPKLELDYGESKIYFYSCAIKEQPKGFEKNYDWSIDLMSPEWDGKKALKNVQEKQDAQICDVLMDQDIFAGLGNIMKNEILFNTRLHPETKVKDLSPPRLKALVKEANRYAWQFYEWKKENVLKRNWQVMRKKTCPICGRNIKKKVTGKLKRWSHFCNHCQKK